MDHFASFQLLTNEIMKRNCSILLIINNNQGTHNKSYNALQESILQRARMRNTA